MTLERSRPRWQESPGRAPCGSGAGLPRGNLLGVGLLAQSLTGNGECHLGTLEQLPMGRPPQGSALQFRVWFPARDAEDRNL